MSLRWEKIVGVAGRILSFAPRDSIGWPTPRFFWQDKPPILGPSINTQSPSAGSETRNGSTPIANAGPSMLPRAAAEPTRRVIPGLQRAQVASPVLWDLVHNPITLRPPTVGAGHGQVDSAFVDENEPRAH